MTKDAYLFRRSLVDYLHTFFRGRGYLEAEVPILAPSLIPEASIRPFRTRLDPPEWAESPPSSPDGGADPNERYLLPSPEYYLKRLLADGWGSLYSIGPCFRNAEIASPRHSTEFTMLEYYGVGSDYRDQIGLTAELFAGLPTLPAASAARLKKPFVVITMEEAFRSLARLELAPAAAPEPGPAGDAEAEARIRELCLSAGVGTSPGDDWNDMFQRAFLTLVEPRLPGDAPTVLVDYPWRVRTTAARKPGTPWAQRWELYLGALELANVYTEERNPAAAAEYAARQRAEIETRGWTIRTDPAYPDIAARLPPCAGAALGVDRLVMAAAGLDSIGQARPFAAFTLGR